MAPKLIHFLEVGDGDLMGHDCEITSISAVALEWKYVTCPDCVEAGVEELKITDDLRKRANELGVTLMDAPPLHNKYWFIASNYGTLAISSGTWSASPVDKNRLRQCNVFDSEIAVQSSHKIITRHLHNLIK